MATFADDTAILAVGREISSSTRRLQSANNRMDSCLANQTE
jgi:hypothetical protein